MKNITLFLYIGFIGFLTSVFSSDAKKPELIEPDDAIQKEYILLKNINRLEKDKFDRNSVLLKASLDSLKNK